MLGQRAVRDDLPQRGHDEGGGRQDVGREEEPRDQLPDRQDHADGGQRAEQLVQRTAGSQAAQALAGRVARGRGSEALRHGSPLLPPAAAGCAPLMLWFSAGRPSHVIWYVLAEANT